MKCDKCGVELIHDPGRGGWPREREDALAHTPERCRDRLAAQLAEAEAKITSVGDTYEQDIREREAALRAELAECRAELEREHEANAHDPVRQKLKAAEARAARYETTLREMRSQCVRGAHSDDDRIIDTIDAALAALAETEKEKP